MWSSTVLVCCVLSQVMSYEMQCAQIFRANKVATLLSVDLLHRVLYSWFRAS